MGTRRLLVVEIGASHVAAGLFGARAGRLVLEQIAREPCDAENPARPRWHEEVARSLGALSIRRNLHANCAIVLPGHLVLTKVIGTPAVPAEKRERSMAFEAAENIPLPLDRVVWGHRNLADLGPDRDVMLVAARLDAVQSLCDAAGLAGFRSEYAAAGSVALLEAFRYNYPGQPEAAIVANIGARSTTLLQVAGEQCRVRTMDLGGNAVTATVMEELRIDFPAAEALKLQVLGGQCTLPAHSPSRVAVAQAAAAFGERLQREVRRTLANWNRQTGFPAAATVLLSGGGALVPGLAGVLAEKLALRVERFEPLRNVILPERAGAAVASAEYPAMAELVGTAVRLLDGSAAEPNLLPPTAVRALAARRRRIPWLAAATLAALAPLPLIASFHRRTTAALGGLVDLERRLAPMRALREQMENDLRQIELAKKRIAALGPAHDVRESWIAFLVELQSKLNAVENVWLDRLGMETGDKARSRVDERGAVLAASDFPRPGAEREPGRLFLSGRLLDVDHPQARVNAESVERVKQLLRQLRESPFVAAVADERFDRSLEGLLRFEVTLVLNPAKPL